MSGVQAQAFGTAAPQAVLVASEHYRRHHYGANHPLSIPRVSLTLDLIRAYGALDEAEFLPARPATRDELQRFHSPAYVSALTRAEAFGGVTDEERQRHHIGTSENPWFPGLFYTPALATGSSIQGAEQVLRGRRAFSPAGGMHHAAPDGARGFCYFNDAVLAILRLREEGLRVLYLDIDAHHGDGVERAFYNDPEVLTLSLHMDTAYAYPFSGGGIGDWGGPQGGAACVNVPLARGTHDAEYQLVFEAVWARVHGQFRPDVVVLQAGTDSLFADPLGRFDLSTRGFLQVVERVVREAARILVIGGGGYHPLLLARCWTGVWGILSGRGLAEQIPEPGRAVLRAAGWDQDEDEDYFPALFERRLEVAVPRPVRSWAPQLLDTLRSTHPLLGEL